jgi:phosphatidylinositol alpha-1,6-mannosyltransferase
MAPVGVRLVGPRTGARSVCGPSLPIVRHLLVTNDFPPKVGGIQSYLWELWRRLPPDDVTVLTTPHSGAAAFDRVQPFRVVRSRQPVLLPSPLVVRQVGRLIAEAGIGAVVLDPAVPLGLVGRSLDRPYAVVLHGAEVAVPGRLPAGRQLLTRVLLGASLVVAAGSYPEAEARRAVADDGAFPPVARIPPGVDTARFRPLAAIDRASARAHLGLPAGGRLVVSVGRLVPRKGMDTLIRAAVLLAPRHPDLTVAIAGTGRDHLRLQRLARRAGAPVRLLGHVPEFDLPSLYGCADVFVMCCRTRWAGLEQEGFGIVFLEASACGVPCIAGDSGGAAEAVDDGETGLVITDPEDTELVAATIGRLLDDPALASRQGQAARRRAETEFSYDRLAGRLGDALSGLGERL